MAWRAAARDSTSAARISIATGTSRRIPSSHRRTPRSSDGWKREITAGRSPHLALELHNDGAGRLHISRPPVPQLDRHLARMATFEELLRKQTWFTEGTTKPRSATAARSATAGSQRYGIDAVVHEFNCNWIEG